MELKVEGTMPISSQKLATSTKDFTHSGRLDSCRTFEIYF